jgi:hypothetical protein
MPEPTGAYAPPWWCRTFGHSFVSRPWERLTGTWMRPVMLPVKTFCHRCGKAPEPAAGECTATAVAFDDKRLFCDLQHGHAGKHHDSATGAHWFGNFDQTDASGDSGTSS